MLSIRREDRRETWGGFALLAGVMAAHATLETARDALFLARLPAEHLPFAYLAIAALAAAFASANHWLLGRFDKRAVLGTSLLAAAALTVLIWVLLGRGSITTLYVLYVWTGVVATMVVVQIWLLLGDVVTVSQAKRVFGVVAAGGLVGATLGSVLAERLVDAVDPRHLVLAAAVLLGITSLGPRLWGEPVTSRLGRRRAPRGGMGLFRSQPYLRRLALLILVSSVALTGVDYVFKSIVADTVPAGDLGTFFARFYLALNVLGLLFQLLLSAWLVRALGVNRALMALPMLLLAGVGGILAATAGALLPVLLLKGADGSLRHSLHRTATEVLYLPLPTDIRDRFKGFIDGVGQRGGQALASLAILAAVALDAPIQHVAAGVGVLVLSWLLIASGIQRHYLELFRGSLREGTIETHIRLSQLDLHSLEALMEALNSDDDGEVRAALDLFAEHDKTHLVPLLILYHPSREVVLRALELFSEAGRRDFGAVAGRLLRHDDEVVQAAALRALGPLEPDGERLREALGSDRPLLHATALVGLIATEPADLEALEADLSEHVEEDEPPIHAALAAAIRQQRDPRFGHTLLRLGRSPDRAVRAEVARAMEAVPSERHLPSLVSMLADAEVRPLARRAILRLGPVALYFLDEALWDRSLPRKVRRHLPRTISRFEPRAAADVLLRHLADERDGMVRFKILRGLGRLRADDPELELDARLIREIALRTLRRVLSLMDGRVALEEAQGRDPSLRTQGGELLAGILREKETNALERVFRLLGLLYPREDFELLHDGILRLDRGARAGAREILEHALSGGLRDAVLALADDAPDPERIDAAAAAMGWERPALGYRDRMLSLLDDPSEAIQSVAAYHIAELGMTELTPRLRAVRPEAPGAVTEVIERALAMLAAAEGGHAA